MLSRPKGYKEDAKVFRRALLSKKIHWVKGTQSKGEKKRGGGGLEGMFRFGMQVAEKLEMLYCNG